MEIHHHSSIILKPELSKILDNFSSIFSVRIAYFLPDGREYRVGKNAESAEYCRIIRDSLGCLETCLALDRKMLTLAASTKSLQKYRCHGGCIEAIKPLFYGDTLTGFIMIGQFSDTLRTPSSMVNLSERMGFRRDMDTAFSQIPHFEQEKIDSIITLFSNLTDLINLKHMIQQKERSWVQKVVEYMEDSKQRVSLREAATIAGKSESRLRHKFKEELGCSFSAFREKICMDKAGKILIERPQISIKELSDQLGFSDPLYFSRVFKKYFGSSPSNYRQAADSKNFT